tara:strand:+ start:301 stop:486 length:186 start_codon:yes stop_codon:yes gene_type:complete
MFYDTALVLMCKIKVIGSLLPQVTSKEFVIFIPLFGKHIKIYDLFQELSLKRKTRITNLLG